MTPEKLTLVLEALKKVYDNVSFYGEVREAIAAIEAVLAQPEQEPVAVDCCANCLRPEHEHQGNRCPKPYTTIWHAWDYLSAPDTTPPHRKPLTPEQFNHMPKLFVIPPHHVEMVVRTIEAAHGIKE